MKGRCRSCMTCTRWIMRSGIGLTLLLSTQGSAFLSSPARPYSSSLDPANARCTSSILNVAKTSDGQVSEKIVEEGSAILSAAARVTVSSPSSAAVKTTGSSSASKKSAPSQPQANKGDAPPSLASEKREPKANDMKKSKELLGTEGTERVPSQSSSKPIENTQASGLSSHGSDGVSKSGSATEDRIGNVTELNTKVRRGANAEDKQTEKKVDSLSSAVVDQSAATDTSEKVAASAANVQKMVSGSVSKKGKKNVATPDTTAAEKVLSLLDLGLVDKDEVTAYYEALSDLERTTREAKAATTRVSDNPATQSKPSAWQENPASILPFPAVCTALGAAGIHSLQLAGDADTVASICGGIAGAAVGGLLVVGDDPVGGFARAFGATIARAVGSAGGWAGKEVSASATGAAGAAVSAAEEVLVKAPANAAGALGKSIADSVSASVTYVLGLPGQLARTAFEGVKSAVLSASEAAVKLPGGLAKKAADAAGEAVQNTSEAAISAVTSSPKEAGKKLQEVVEVVSSPKRVFESATSLLKRSPGKTAQVPTELKKKATEKATLKVQPTATAQPSVMDQIAAMTLNDEAKEEEEVDGVAVEELEAKMSSVQEALARFDAVKSRIENARTSGTLREAVSMTRNAYVDKGSKLGEAVGSAAKNAERRGDKADGTTTSRQPPRAAESRPSPRAEEQKTIDANRRKRVAEILLEKASQRAEDAKAGLKIAAASARRNTRKSSATTKSPAGSGVAEPAPVE